MRGSIHSIMLFCEAWRESVVGMVVIFCITHIDAPTRMGRMGVGSGSARSIQRKSLFRGTAWLTWGNQE